MMKVLAGLLGVGFDEIKQRDLVRKQKRAAVMGGASFCLALVMGIMTAWAIGNSKDAERQRVVAEKERDLARQNHYIAQKLNQLYLDLKIIIITQL